jgi:hypothetical protein
MLFLRTLNTANSGNYSTARMTQEALITEYEWTMRVATLQGPTQFMIFLHNIHSINALC